MPVDLTRLSELAVRDRALGVALGRLTARVRIGPDGDSMDVVIRDGAVTAVEPPVGDAALVITAPPEFWHATLVPTPAYAACSLTAGGAVFDGDFAGIVAPYYGAWERLLVLMRRAACGEGEAPPPPPARRETDDAVGRYAYVRNGGQEARIYYETAGDGAVPLLLHATAGADARQWRHMLSEPELRRRFRMIAYDLPMHGKSLPPVASRWWEEQYRPGREVLMGWAVGLVETLGLDRPLFLGCSVGGQLALDLAAWHADRFRGFVSLNGWSSPSPAMRRFDNAPFRDPAVSHVLTHARVLATTSPLAPEESRREAAWIYASNAPGIYAGDNDYFMTAHDLGLEGGRIDARRTPLYVLAGEYDRSAASPEHGAPAVPTHVPGAVYRELPGLGHFAPSDDPAAFCAAIVPILDEVLAACAQDEAAAA